LCLGDLLKSHELLALGHFFRRIGNLTGKYGVFFDLRSTTTRTGAIACYSMNTSTATTRGLEQATRPVDGLLLDHASVCDLKPEQIIESADAYAERTRTSKTQSERQLFTDHS